jgi:hypothetical protein
MLTIFTDHSYTVLTFYYTGARRACPSSNTDYRQFDNSELSCPVRIFRVKAVQPFGVIAQSPLVVCPRAGLPLAARGRITSRSSRKVAERLLQRPYKSVTYRSESNLDEFKCEGLYGTVSLLQLVVGWLFC